MWLEISFKFWIVSDFLQKPLAWFSKFYLRVQSENCWKNSFFCFLLRFFSIFERKFIRLLAKKLQKFVKTIFCVSTGTTCGFKFLKKIWTVFDFLQKPLAWFSKFYLRVQSKNCGKIFFCFLFRNFSDFERKLSNFWPKNVKNLSKLPSTCPEGQFVAWFFLKFWIVPDFLQKPLAWFSKFYLRVQSKNCGKRVFFVFLSRNFSNLSKIFSKFWPKNFKNLWKLPSACPEEQFVAWNIF